MRTLPGRRINLFVSLDPEANCSVLQDLSKLARNSKERQRSFCCDQFTPEKKHYCRRGARAAMAAVIRQCDSRPLCGQKQRGRTKTTAQMKRPFLNLLFLSLRRKWCITGWCRCKPHIYHNTKRTHLCSCEKRLKVVHFPHCGMYQLRQKSCKKDN